MPVPIEHSLSLEALADRLAEKIRATPRDPMKPVRVLVQSLGWKVWLSRRLATRLGVAMNLRFDFPRDYVRELAASAGESPENWFAWEKDALEWRIHALLPTVSARPEFEAVRRYLADDVSGVMRVQLAQALAHRYDQYLLFRPDWIRAWERGRRPVAADTWQGPLWRALGEEGAPREHFPAFLEKLASGAITLPPSDEPVFLFGVTGLPPAFHGVFEKLSETHPVHAFQNVLSNDYLGDGAGGRRLRAKELRAGVATVELEGAGHPLLAASGRQAAVTQGLILDQGWLETQIDAPEDEAEPATLLARLQREVRENRTTAEEYDAPLAPDDSLRIHACHNPMREVEVLHDELLHALATLPDLRPRDIVVMAPDIEAYAPVIRAVFGRETEATPRLPYGIADRPPVEEKPLFAHFAALLRLPQSRLTAADLTGLVDSPVTRARIGLTEENRDVPAHWLREAHLTWGADAEARARTGAPAFHEGSWRDFLARLRLGLAMEGDGDRLFASPDSPYAHLPLAGLEGARAALAGRLAERLENWLDWVAASRGEHTPREWLEHAARLLDGLVPEGEAGEPFVEDLRDLRRLMERLRQTLVATGHDAPMPYGAFLAAFEPHLQVSRQAGAFLTGGVTFCALKPLRAIPARVIALLGIDAGKFPRPARRDGFDLMATAPRAGDPSRTDDDRHLFLETLLAARDRVIVTYLGRDAREDKPKPAATVVDELLEALAPHVDAPEALRVEHPPFPYSSRYFTEEGRARGLRTYREACALGASALTKPARRPEPFVGDALVAEDREDGEPEEITFESWEKFWTKPAAWFLGERLHLRFPRDEDAPPEDEFPDPARRALDAYARRDFAFACDPATPDRLALARAKGVTLPGAPGAVSLRAADEEAGGLRRVADALGSAVPFTCFHSEILGGYRLTLRLTAERRGDALTLYRMGKLRDADRMKLRWLAVWLGLLPEKRRDGITRVALVHRDKDDAGATCADIPIRPEAEGRLLGALTEIDAARERPWPLPLACGAALVEAWQKHADAPAEVRRREAAKAVAGAWRNFNGGDSDDPANLLVYGEDFLERLDTLLTPEVATKLVALWDEVDAALGVAPETPPAPSKKRAK